MRLALESPSPHMVSRASTIRQLPNVLSHSSAFSPIDVEDDESTDDAEPQSPCVHDASAMVHGPSLLPHFTKTETIDPYEREHSDEGKRTWREYPDNAKELTNGTGDASPKRKPPLDFFFDTDRRPSKPIESQNETNWTGCDQDLRDQERKVLSAARTSIGGKKFDRCELEFGADRVNLTIWKAYKARWKGDVKYAHMERFCFSQTGGPPYVLVLQLDDANRKSDFATFFDSILARKMQHHDQQEQAGSKMDYMRCLSMIENNPDLACFLNNELSEDEVQEYLRLDAMQIVQFNEGKRSSSPRAASNFAALVGNGAKQALGSVTSFFRSTARPSVLEQEENHTSLGNDSISSRVRTLNLSRSSSELSSPSTAGSNKRKREVGDAGRNGDEGSNPKMLRTFFGTETTEIDAWTSWSKPQDKKASKNIESKKELASDSQENGREKQRKTDDRRHQELLEYPFDGSDTLGRISVTLGDVARLQPGEFLNDNIIDLYLRFLWRHLDPIQQQQMYFFTSHFFTHLNGTNGATELSKAAPSERFARVARWTHKETNLFDKRFLFIPINDRWEDAMLIDALPNNNHTFLSYFVVRSFHWSIAVFCNPGSAVIKKHRKVRRRYRHSTGTHSVDPQKVVDLVDGDDNNSSDGGGLDETSLCEDIEEKELPSCQQDRLAYPPCLLFLDSLRCHRKKKFTQMLRNYLECEFKARFASTCADSSSKQNLANAADRIHDEDTILTIFDAESICLLEPKIPLQTNNSDCGVFLLMYAASIVRFFPFGVTRADVESNLAPKFTATMFREEHVLEFREYLQQLLFCLQFLGKHGLPERNIIDEGLATFNID
ncbi:hypothetical protein PsorP6_002958 [Peronosclerospora sorghi]|uniref:Uncharacterized protein n=1 Tax=Peronosclerospora sorghi TaxID=230839 RepID=A0ACC0VIZ0_9STRA|nr:hypothetical protein PsorP6_002958 [Peronosclerospora sorghi]